MNKTLRPFSVFCSEPMDQDNNNEASEMCSHHAVRQRCLSALAAASTHPSVVQESTPVLMEVLSSAHTGDLSGWLVCLASDGIILFLFLKCFHKLSKRH